MPKPEEKPLVSDELLAHLAAPDYAAARGEFDAETRALLATALPEICAELLRWRRTAREHPVALSLALRSEAIADRLDRARQTIRAPEPITRQALSAACETILKFSTDATERMTAQRLLDQITEAA